MPLSFNQAWNWNTALGSYENTNFYPNSSDLLIKVAGGVSDQNIVFAELINRIQNSVQAVERRVQYTPITGNPSGSFIYRRALDVYQLAPGHIQPDYTAPFRVGIKISVPISDANKYFGGKAFNSIYGVATSAYVYLPTGTGNVYKPCGTGFNPTGDNTGVMTITKVSETFQQYEVIDPTLYIIRP